MFEIAKLEFKDILVEAICETISVLKYFKWKFSLEILHQKYLSMCGLRIGFLRFGIFTITKCGCSSLVPIH
jgi:hypothetical protein